jgi:2,5-diamino-6-(ribosylamino)-4(3H)-pyrimidinone 5'-phosphate reductase
VGDSVEVGVVGRAVPLSRQVTRLCAAECLDAVVSALAACPAVCCARSRRARGAREPNDIDGDHVVSILSERVSDEYLALLRERGVSYLLAGARDVDLPLALEKIRARFGVGTLMLEGGGRINGGLLRAGLIDEVSLLVAPVADGRVGTPALFDVDGSDATPCHLALEAVERRADDVLWLRYRVESR